ncbi:MAG: hypothetical protein HY961_10890 [Ignavibacteriae bacterium]|nr:hypothetical protein [Ignavibacteriota bacterium]
MTVKKVPTCFLGVIGNLYRFPVVDSAVGAAVNHTSPHLSPASKVRKIFFVGLQLVFLVNTVCYGA